MRRTNVYIAGPLFTEAEITQRKQEGAATRAAASHLPETEVFNPIESPVNFKEMEPTSRMIYEADYNAMKESLYFFFDLSNADQGTFVELGMALMWREKNPGIKIYPVFSDIRIPNAGEYDGIHVPVGVNQFVIGALEYYGIDIYYNFSDALDQFVLDVHKAQ